VSSLTPEDVRKVQFAVKRRGYDQVAVNGFVREVESALRFRDSETRKIAERLQTTRGELEAVRSNRPAVAADPAPAPVLVVETLPVPVAPAAAPAVAVLNFDVTGDEEIAGAVQLLAVARKVAETVVADANVYAAELVEKGHANADAYRDRVHAEAENVRDSVAGLREQALMTAAAEADALVSAAVEEAALLTDAATAEAATLRDEAVRAASDARAFLAGERAVLEAEITAERERLAALVDGFNGFKFTITAVANEVRETSATLADTLIDVLVNGVDVPVIETLVVEVEEASIPAGGTIEVDLEEELNFDNEPVVEGTLNTDSGDDIKIENL
jgi:DivIVA domain-containing protein